MILPSNLQISTFFLLYNLQSTFFQCPYKLNLLSTFQRIHQAMNGFMTFCPINPIILYPNKKQTKLTLPVKIS